jgi:hypothetical protein
VQERAGEGGDQVRKFTSWGARAYPHASEIIGQNIMCQLTVRRHHRSTHGLKRDCHEPGSRGIKPGMIAPFRRIASSPSREEGVRCPPDHRDRSRHQGGGVVSQGVKVCRHGAPSET